MEQGLKLVEARTIYKCMNKMKKEAMFLSFFFKLQTLHFWINFLCALHKSANPEWEWCDRYVCTVWKNKSTGRDTLYSWSS